MKIHARDKGVFVVFGYDPSPFKILTPGSELSTHAARRARELRRARLRATP